MPAKANKGVAQKVLVIALYFPSMTAKPTSLGVFTGRTVKAATKAALSGTDKVRHYLYRNPDSFVHLFFSHG